MSYPTAERLYVVVPAYNEQDWIEAALDGLARQTDTDFRVVVVDNGSTDETGPVIRRWLAGHPEMDVTVLTEPEKGTGAAADTGFCHAIDAGADWVARTDADCVPAPDWVASIRARSAATRMIAGRSVARNDDFPISPAQAAFLRALYTLAGWFGKLRPANRGPEYRRGYVVCPGHNMAIEAELYEQAGGFPRTSIEELHEDRALANRARTVTADIRPCPDVIVAVSTRRLQRLGLARTLLWYWDHRYRPAEVDIR